MPRTENQKQTLCVEASCGSVVGTFDPNRQRGITISATINGGGLQEFAMSRGQAVRTALVLNRLIRAMREDEHLGNDYLELLDRGLVSWRRFASPPASNKTGGRTNA